MWALKRRVYIILLLTGFFVCFCVIPYIILHIEKPSCFDGKLNQHEEGIDCGGECVLVCKGKAEDLSVLWKKVFEVRPNVYEVGFFVENKNFSVGASRVPYTIRITDSNGVLLDTREGITYAGSNETFLIYEGNISAKGGAPSAEISFGSFPWVTTEKHQALFSVGDKLLQDVDARPRLSASIHNDTLDTERAVEVDAVVSDDTGNVVGFGKTVVEALSPGGSQAVTFTWPTPFSYQASLETCDKPADIILAFDRSGSMASDGKNPPEPLTTAKEAAQTFVEHLRASDQMGIVSFATTASHPIDRFLTSEKEKIHASIEDIDIGKDGLQYTNIGDALDLALLELQSLRRNPKAIPSVVLMTDGDPTYPEHPDDKGYPLYYAKEKADMVKKAGIALYTIGLGKEAHADILQSLATTPEQYYAAQRSEDLAAIYTKISSVLCKKAPSIMQIFPRVNNVEAPAH